MRKFLIFVIILLSLVSEAYAQAATPCSKYSFGGLAGTVQTVKGSPAILCGYQILNTTAAVCYLQIFDTTGAVTLGTTVPDQSLGWPASAGGGLSGDR